MLLGAFALSVMADPVSSVAYAIEAALRALDGELRLLLPTMAPVVAIIALVITNYHQLVGRFPEGGGAAAAAGTTFGEAWAFIPIGALIVDFLLTIAISVSAAASAMIALFPSSEPFRVPLALLFLSAVAGLTWFGHLGRAVFATMAAVFVGVAAVIVVNGLGAPPATVTAATGSAGHPAFAAILLAFPVAMALATGVEAPSSTIAQLGQLDDDGRRRFGPITLWLTLGVVSCLTLGLTVATVRLGIGVPGADSTLIAQVARVSAGDRLYGLFQAVTVLLLLAAASSSFQARAWAAEGAGSPRRTQGRADRGPARAPRCHQCPVHPVLGRPGVLHHLRGGRPAWRRPGPGAGPLLRRRGVHQLPGGTRRNGAIRSPRAP